MNHVHWHPKLAHVLHPNMVRRSNYDFLLEQTDRHLQQIPDAYGFCIDRMDWLRMFNLDRDDGRSWFNDQPAGSLILSWHSFMDRFAEKVHGAGKVIFVNNHTKRIDLLRHADGSFEWLKSRPGFVLAGMEGVRYRENVMELAQGDTLYLYTDGVTEATNGAQELFGDDRLQNALNEQPDLPVDDLRRAYEQDGRGDAFEREVLVLRSATETVIDALGVQEVPAKFQTDAFYALESAVQKYKRYCVQKSDAAKELAKTLLDAIRTELEPAFRREVEAMLRKEFPGGPAARREAIRRQKNYRWISTFYPAVFWSERKVLLLSVKKLMARNITIVEPSFECLSDRMLQGAILCLDEFDASRETVLDCLIERSLQLRADYLQLFDQVYKGIQMHQASRELTSLRERYENGRALTWQDLIAQAESIYQDGALQYSMKAVEAAQGHGRNFLFHDTSYLTILDEKRTHIWAVRNDDQAQVQIHFDTPENYTAHRQDPSRIVLQNILRRIHVFLLPTLSPRHAPVHPL